MVKLFLHQETIDERIKDFIFENLGKYYDNFLTETVEKQETIEMQQGKNFLLPFFVLFIEEY